LLVDLCWSRRPVADIDGRGIPPSFRPARDCPLNRA